MEKIICHDCQKNLTSGEPYMPYQEGKNKFSKCQACYEQDPVLRNFQKTEVYSRVVGYIRPVEQWNKGKQAEFSQRKEFIVSEPGCC
jgi:ribonucleoside-triphosphate reductase (formate)